MAEGGRRDGEHRSELSPGTGNVPSRFETRAHRGRAALSCANGDLHPCHTQPVARPISRPCKDFAHTPTSLQQVSSLCPGQAGEIPGHPVLQGLHPCPVTRRTPGPGHRTPLHPQGYSSLSDPFALLQGLRLLVPFLAFDAGDDDLLSQAEARALGPWQRRAPAALPVAGPGRASFSLPFLSQKTPHELYARTRHIFPRLL